MNRKTLRDFTEWFSKNRRYYNQRSCATCLAAHAAAWKDKLKRGDLVCGEAGNFVEIFGLDTDTAYELYWHTDSWLATRATAVKVLKRLARTGEVQWPEAPPLHQLRRRAV